MSLESGTYVSDLVATNPTGTDPKSQGDDHLRLIKSTLKNTFPNATGPQPTMAFCKNKLFNGEVTRINQRGFDGNWATKNIWASGNTIAQQELCYGYDMWAKASATDMVQVIEEGNFRPSTVHTISGLNMTTRQETSPASGNWNIVVPQAARNVQVEEGSVATPFEIRPISFELAQCQRYYEVLNMLLGNSWSTQNASTAGFFSTKKRVGPAIGVSVSSVELIGFGSVQPTSSQEGELTVSSMHVMFTYPSSGIVGGPVTVIGNFTASAVI